VELIREKERQKANCVWLCCGVWFGGGGGVGGCVRGGGVAGGVVGGGGFEV